MSAASIVIDLLMKTGSFETDTKRAQKELAKLKKEAADIGKVVGIAFAGAIAATAAFVKQTVDAADDMGKAAQKVGVTVEALSGLKYAADLSGVSFEGLQTGLKKLSVSIYEAGQGSKEQAEAFKRLGISVKDTQGNLKSADAVLSEVAERFENLPDGVDKTALAVKLFGKAGADMIPLLNAGADGIKKLTDEAERFGIVISSETAKAAEEFNDQMSRVGAAFDGLKLQLTAAVLPLLNEFANAMVTAASETKDLADTDTTTWAQKFAYGMAFAADATAAAMATFRQFARSVAVVFNDIKTFAQIGTYLANPITAFMNRDKIAQLIRDNKNFTKEANADLQDYLNGNYTRFRDSLSKTYSSAASAKKNFQGLVDVPEKSGGSKKSSKGTSLASIQADAFLDDMQLLKKQLEAEGKDIAEINRVMSDSFDEEWERISDAVGDDEVLNHIKALKEEAIALQEDTKTPLEKFSEQMQKIKQLLDLGFINPETAGRAMQKFYDDFSGKTKETTDQVTEFWKEAARNMQDAMSDFFFDAMQGKLSDLASSFKATIDRMVANLLASQLTDFLFGAEFGKDGQLGGLAGDLFGSLKDLLPSFDVGTPFVPHDMVAVVHRGERIVPAAQNNSSSMGGSVYVNMTVNTPDANSFRKSQPQIAAEMQRNLNRGRRVV